MTQGTIENTKPRIHRVEVTIGVWTEFCREERKDSRQTKNIIVKSAEIIVRIIGLFIGHGFTTPILKVAEEDPFTTTQIPL
jgi:hypothetical protein